MKLTAEQKDELTEFGKLQFTIEECEAIMGIEFNDEVMKLYNTGRLLAIAEIRKAILTQAKQGSSPAQKQILDICDKTIKENNTKNKYYK